MSTVEKPPPDWELVLKRNPVERLKQEKAPLGIRDELPALIAAGYETVAEEDIVRLQWWGLYHDKPKIGTFMLRIKVPAGQLSPGELRAIGEVSNLYGRGDGELSTRQNIQLHWLELAKLPDVFAHLEASGVTTAGGCGDTVRNITGCPVQGIAADELFDATPIVDAAADLFYGNPDWANLPRKHKYSISACADRCNAPEINCISLIGTVTDDGREGFAVHVGGGLSSVPRIATRHGRLHPQGGRERDPRRDHLGLVGRPQVPRLAREGAAQVHGRRHRPRGDPRARRGAPRQEARGLLAAADHGRAVAPPRHPRPAPGGAQLHRRARPSRPRLGRPDDRRSPIWPSATAATSA